MCNLSQGIKEQCLEQGIERGIERGIEQGILKGRSSEIFESVQEGDYSIERGAQKMNLSVEEFEKSMIEAGYEIPSVIP